MKKIILTLALVAVAATSAMAQFSVGAGYLNTLATYTTSNSTSKTTFNGFYAGIDASYDLGSGVAVVPGVYYGYLTSSDNFLGIASGKTTDHYIAVPVNFKYGYELTSGLTAFAYAGPQFNFCVASNTETTVLGSTSTTDNFGKNSSLNRFDIAASAGLGVEIANMVRIQGGYTYGFLNQYNSSDITLKNSGWHIGAAFMF